MAKAYDGVLGRGGLCKTRAFDGLCWEGYHEFEDAGYLMTNPKSVPTTAHIPLESCKHCGLLRLVPKEDKDER